MAERNDNDIYLPKEGTVDGETVMIEIGILEGEEDGVDTGTALGVTVGA